MKPKARNLGGVVLIMGTRPGVGALLPQEAGKKTSIYAAVVIQEDFARIMARMKAAKPDVMRRQMSLLEERHDLSNRPASGRGSCCCHTPTTRKGGVRLLRTIRVTGFQTIPAASQAGDRI